MIQLVTWNVNSLKVRLPQLLDWLAVHQPDAVCLQETKLEDHNFPHEAIREAGYYVLYSGQKTYNGVAVLSRKPAHETVTAIPGFIDEQKRVLAVTVDGLRVICVYIPNGESIGSDKYQYKLKWLAALHHWLKDELIRYPKLALLGDFNIAPEECDVYDPIIWEDQVMFSPPEREAFQALLKLGLKDSFRLFQQPDKAFTWWDYRMNAFRQNRGLRIDHILLSDALARNCKSCFIDIELRKKEKPSDHAPVIAEIEG